MNAVMPSSWPDASCCQSSQPTLIVVSAEPASSVTCCAAPSSMMAPSLPPKSILTRLPGTQAWFCAIFATSSCFVIPVSFAASLPAR
jgi:hypothetical protein